MQQQFFIDLRNGWEGKCPCCNRFAKVYHRAIHTSVALQLIQLLRLGGGVDFIHASRLIPRGITGSGDFSKAKYWSLIEESPNTDEAKKASGSWRLTSLGIDFVRGQARLKKYAAVYDDCVLWVHGPMVSIEDCLKDKFDYQELMEGV